MSNLLRALVSRGPLRSVRAPSHIPDTSNHRDRGHDGEYAPTSSPGVTDAVDPYQILYLRSLGIPHVVLRLK